MYVCTCSASSTSHPIISLHASIPFKPSRVPPDQIMSRMISSAQKPAKTPRRERGHFGVAAVIYLSPHYLHFHLNATLRKTSTMYRDSPRMSVLDVAHPIIPIASVRDGRLLSKISPAEVTSATHPCPNLFKHADPGHRLCVQAPHASITTRTPHSHGLNRTREECVREVEED
jgi:hypothetical protein